MARLVSKVYGEALFEFAKEQEQLEKMCEEAYDIVVVFASSKELNDFVCSPSVKKEDKIKYANDLFINNFWAGPLAKVLKVFDIDINKGENPKILDFLSMIIEKDRQKDIVEIFKHFITLTLEEKNIGQATVTTVNELTDSQKKELEKKLIDVTRYDKFVVDYKIDKDLIAGIKVKIGDKVFDKSYKTKLFDFSKSLRGLKL